MVRVAFYSHDTFGLGHLRRCLKLTRTIRSALTDVEGLLITGSPWVHLFPCPPGFEVFHLPPILKRGRSYQPAEQGADLAEVLDFRERYLTATLRDFRPDLLIVDNVPCGLKGEILSALRSLRAKTEAKCVLALRDVLDRPQQIAREWTEAGAEEALQSLYHEAWVFGDRQDLQSMVTLPGMSAVQLRVCGRIGLGRQLDQILRGDQQNSPTEVIDTIPRVLVTGGGGGDADALVTTYLEMLRSHRPAIRSHIVLGPDFSSARSQKLLANNGFGARIDSFVGDLPAAMDRADLVVGMAGYNTICEIEALGKRAVLVPRVWPREEQLLRARKQEQAGRATVIHPSELDPETLWGAMQTCLARPYPLQVHHLGAEKAGFHAARLLDRDLCVHTSGIAS